MPTPPPPNPAFTYVSIACFALPALAAWRVRCPLLRDPAGQIAAVWLFFVPYRLLSRALNQLDYDTANHWLGATGVLLLPLMLAPPLLTWAGPRAKRRQPLVLGAIVLAVVVALALLGGPERRFIAVASPVETMVVAVLATAALMGRLRHHVASGDPTPVRRTPWVWICGGLLAYSIATVTQRPLTEVLMTMSWDVMLRTYYGFLLAVGAAMLPIAYGVLLTARTGAPAPPERRDAPSPHGQDDLPRVGLA